MSKEDLTFKACDRMVRDFEDVIKKPVREPSSVYYTGVDPRTMKPVYVPKSPHEKAMQRALIQYRNPELYDLVSEALHKAGRTDLIGFGPKCLIRPRKFADQKKDKRERNSSQKTARSSRDTSERSREERAAQK